MNKSNKTGFTHESQHNTTIEWYTPASIFEALGTDFSIDVCSPLGGLPWIPAARFLSKEHDGLATEWDGFVWCNPPYGKQTPLWLSKMKQHNNGIALVFSRTDCKWFHDYVATSDVVLFLKSRIKFVDWYGETGNSGAGNGSMLVGYGDKAKAVIEQCKLGGALYYPKKKE